MHPAPAALLQLLTLGKTFNTKSYLARGRKSLPGVHPAATAVWNVAAPPPPTNTTDNSTNPAPIPPSGGNASAAGVIGDILSAITTPLPDAWRVPAAAIVPGNTPGLADWSATCGVCSTAPVLTPAQRAHCSSNCGFWARPQMGAARRGGPGARFPRRLREA